MSAEATNDIENRFSFHPASDDTTRNAHEAIRNALKTVAHFVSANVPDGREKSLALTKLEEAMFWANAGIARQGAPTDHTSN